MSDLEGFKAYALGCASRRAANEDKRVFSQLKIERHRGESATLTLRDCALRQAEIAGQFWWMCWEGVDFDRVDFSHTGGVAHWGSCRFSRCNLRSLMATVSATYCVFEKCDFRSGVLEDPFFLGCTFRSLSFAGLALKRAMLVDCVFEDVEFADSRWYATRRFEVSGSWRGERRELALPGAVGPE